MNNSNYDLILYDYIFFEHIIYKLDLDDLFTLLLVNKIYYKVIINQLLNKIFIKIYKLLKIDSEVFKKMLIKNNTSIYGDFLISCLLDLCNKDKVSILHINKYNPYKTSSSGNKLEDYERYSLNILKLNIEPINRYSNMNNDIENYLKFNKNIQNLNMNMDINIYYYKYNHYDVCLNFTHKEISITNIYNLYSSRDIYGTNYNQYKFYSDKIKEFIFVNKNHKYLRNGKFQDLYKDFKKNIIPQIKNIKLYYIKNLKYYRNNITGENVNIHCQLSRKNKAPVKRILFGYDRWNNPNLLHYGRIDIDRNIRLIRTEVCKGCFVSKYGGIRSDHYHFYKNNCFEYKELIFIVKS